MGKDELDIITTLGVTERMEFLEGYVIIEFFKNNKLIGKRRVDCVSDKSCARGLKRLGIAYGINLCHCFYLGHKYCKDFSNKVRVYSVVAGGRNNCAMTVTFYGNK